MDAVAACSCDVSLERPWPGSPGQLIMEIDPREENIKMGSCNVRLECPLPAYKGSSAGQLENIKMGSTQFLKVPVDQRRANAQAYHPLLFSFGPYHITHPPPPFAAARTSSHNLNQLHELDSLHFPPAASQPQFATALTDGYYLKKKIAMAVLQAEDGLKQIAEEILKKHRGNIGNLYVSQPMIISEKDLALLLALDGVTLVEAEREAKKTITTKTEAQLLAYPIVRLVLLDSILLENQVPIFVLDCTLKIVQQSATSTTSIALHEVLLWYCSCLNPFPEFQRLKPPSLSRNMEEPLLSYIYDFLTEGAGTEEPELGLAVDEQNTHKESSAFYRPSLPTASHLLRCGVRFKPNKKVGFSGIRFDKKSMELRLPTIVVGDTTVRFLHNLIAYEATSRYPRQFSVISYVYFMDRLIDTREDVQVLVNAGVLCNTLGSDKELANCWNKLCVSVSYRATTNDQQIMEAMDALAKQRWRKWMATFKETYWEKTPWLLFSIVAALVLLVLTFLQTIYTMIG